MTDTSSPTAPSADADADPRQPRLSLPQVLGALSCALDLPTGQPLGHAQRSCLIGMRLAEEIHLPLEQRTSLYCALLIKDAGCSSNAARLHDIFGADERAVKRAGKLVDWSRPLDAAVYGLRNTLRGAPLLARLRQLGVVARSGAFGREIIETRCNRGAAIALSIGLPDEAAECIRYLDEHWDGHGSPYHIAGDAIPLLARVACLAQTLEVFAAERGLESGYDMLARRSGRWFDPALARAAAAFQADAAFWSTVYGDDPLAALERDPARGGAGALTGARIDAVCAAFGQIVDAKSPFTARHSARVSDYAVLIARALGLSAERVALLRRAGLLHDIGKLSVPNCILDKPGPLTAGEWATVRRHPEFSRRILGGIDGFERIAEIAAAHHERLDGTGYHRGLAAAQLDLDQRVLAAADVYDALSEERPYRAALPRDAVFALMRRDAGSHLDPSCIEALENYAARGILPSSSAAAAAPGPTCRG